jgi:hypothetical protein
MMVHIFCANVQFYREMGNTQVPQIEKNREAFLMVDTEGFNSFPLERGGLINSESLIPALVVTRRYTGKPLQTA